MARQPLNFDAVPLSKTTSRDTPSSDLLQPAPLVFVVTEKKKPISRTPFRCQQSDDTCITSPAPSDMLFDEPAYRNSTPAPQPLPELLLKNTDDALTATENTPLSSHTNPLPDVINAPAATSPVAPFVTPLDATISFCDDTPLQSTDPSACAPEHDHSDIQSAAPSSHPARVLCENSSSSQTRTSYKQLNPRVLRPLASFLNGFYETARAITSQSQVSRPTTSSHRPRSRRPMTATRLEHIPATTMDSHCGYEDRSFAMAFEEEEEATFQDDDDDGILRFSSSPSDLSAMFRPQYVVLS